MQSFIIMLLTCSVTMSVLAIFYMAVTPFLEKRYCENGRYYSWLIIVMGLIIPFRPQWGNAIVKIDVPGNTAVPIVQIAGETTFTIPTIIPIDNITISNTAPSSAAITWWQFAAAVWLAGVIVFLAYHAIKHYRFVKAARRWSENITDEQVLSLLQSLKAEMGIRKRIELYLCSCVGSPMMIGFLKPRILLPTVESSHDELRFILKHELVHYKRKDLLYKYLVLIATAIHWFNPIVYMMAKAIDVLCEMSCDAEVVQSADEDMRQHYGETIIGSVKYRSELKTVLSTNFYGGKKGMKKRISSIMDTKKKRMGIALLCVALIFTLGTAMVFAANTGEFRAGDTVVVQVIADSVSDLWAYEFTLRYDDNAIKIKSIHSAIHDISVFAKQEDGFVSVGAAKLGNSDGINGDNMLICEIVMKVLRDGPVDRLSIQDLYVMDFAMNFLEDISDWEVKVVPNLSVIVDGDETNLMQPQSGELPEMFYSEDSFYAEYREPGYHNGEYSGQLRLNVEKQDVSPGESFWVDVSLSEPAVPILGDVFFWFDPDELTYMGFDADEKVHPTTQGTNPGIANVSFVPLDENGNQGNRRGQEMQTQMEHFGRFHFKVPENPQLSGRRPSMVIVGRYDNGNREDYVIYAQSGEVSISIR